MTRSSLGMMMTFSRIYEAQVLFGHFFNVFGGAESTENRRVFLIFCFELFICPLEFGYMLLNSVVFINRNREVVQHVSQQNKANNEHKAHQG